MSGPLAGEVLIVAVVACCAFGHGFSRGRGNLSAAAGFAALACAAETILAAIDAMDRDWLASAIALAVAAFWFWIWRRNRGNRKRSLRALGNKARARLAAMARNMPKPGPVLRPVPQGSGT